MVVVCCSGGMIGWHYRMCYVVVSCECGMVQCCDVL